MRGCDPLGCDLLVIWQAVFGGACLLALLAADAHRCIVENSFAHDGWSPRSEKWPIGYRHRRVANGLPRCHGSSCGKNADQSKSSAEYWKSLERGRTRRFLCNRNKSEQT